MSYKFYIIILFSFILLLIINSLKSKINNYYSNVYKDEENYLIHTFFNSSQIDNKMTYSLNNVIVQ